MAKIQLLHGPAADEALAEEPTESFGYQMNKFSVGALVGLGLVVLLGAFLTWVFTRLDSALFTTLFVGLMVAGMTLLSYGSYWMNFTRDSFVAVSPTYLFVGRKGRLWRIAWSLLDAKAMGFHDLTMTRMTGFLDLNVAGQHVKVHLFNAFAFLENIEVLMLHILEHLKSLQPDAEELQSEPPE
jgi:hypothetical protein